MEYFNLEHTQPQHEIITKEEEEKETVFPSTLQKEEYVS